MLPEVPEASFTPIEIPKVHRNWWGLVKIAAATLVVGGLAGAWIAGYRPPMLRGGTQSAFDFIEIDRGDVDLCVVETGSIESANNTTVRCEVEALIGMVGGAQGATSKGGATSGTSAQGASGASGTAGGASGSGTAATSTAKKTGTSASTSKTGSTASGSSSSSSSGSSSSSSASGSGASGSSGGASSTSAATTSTSSASLTKPVLRSFTYVVTPYVPARPATTKSQDTTTKKQADTSQGKGGGGGGGRGGGRGGRGGGGNPEDEKPGSTRIVTILPEGHRVKTGDVVVQLDASAYEEEERSQKIRSLQAGSYVEQAESMLEVARIALREYRDGIFPQDLQLIRQYIASCEIERSRSAGNLKWSREMLAMSYRTPFQVKSDELALQQAEIALLEANGMLRRLSQWTAPKIIKQLEANVAAIESDLLTQKASFSLEDQRLKRLQRNIAHCTVKAPGDGIVVYANQADRFGQVTSSIDEGVPVREKQPIFNLPDPQHMRVKAKINETKVALVQPDQPVRILVDAFPGRLLKGVVGEVVPISIPIRGSDVRIYYANVEITEGFDALRPVSVPRS